MHEFKRFIQQQLDARGWKQADLVRASGLSRSHVSKLMRDDREHLGQMPEADTLAGLARGFTIPEEIVRTAASRALVGYEDDGHPIQFDLTEVTTDALLQEVRRRIESTGVGHGERTEEVAEPRTQARSQVDSSEARGDRLRPGAPMNGDNVAPLTRKKQDSSTDAQPSTIPSEPRELAAMTGETDELRRRRLEGEPGEQPDPEGPEYGA